MRIGDLHLVERRVCGAGLESCGHRLCQDDKNKATQITSRLCLSLSLALCACRSVCLGGVSRRFTMNVCTSCAEGYRLSKETEASMDLVVQEANTLLTGCHPENRTKSTSQCLHARKHPPDNTGLKHGAGYSSGSSVRLRSARLSHLTQRESRALQTVPACPFRSSGVQPDMQRRARELLYQRGLQMI